MTTIPALSRILIAVSLALLLAGCPTKAKKPGPAEVETKDVATQKQTDAQKAAAEAERQKREAEARKKADEEAKRKAAEAEAARRAQAEKPVVKPLGDTSVTEKSLADATSQLKDPNSPLAKRSIYYEFDSFEIQQQYEPIVENHAKFLADHAQMKIRIEGHCDERGSREYNLALGQRRADSVKRALMLLGVPNASIVETVSFGSEKPKALGHDEDAWAENRRVDLVYIEVDAPK
jgi:peptidoglycan-associated lipoprotein